MRGCKGCSLGKLWSTSLRNFAPIFDFTLQEKSGVNQVIFLGKREGVVQNLVGSRIHLGQGHPGFLVDGGGFLEHFFIGRYRGQLFVDSSWEIFCN